MRTCSEDLRVVFGLAWRLQAQNLNPQQVTHAAPPDNASPPMPDRKVAFVASCLLACGLLTGAALATASTSTAASPVADRKQPPRKTLSTSALANLAYSGLSGSAERMRLVNGKWSGSPPDAESSLSPTLKLVREFVARGDLDGDGREEAVVVLHHWTGGSGVFVHLAVVTQRNGKAMNVATALLGDRIRVSSLRIDQQSIVADLVVAGPNDPSCCPSLQQRRSWKLKGDKLEQTATLNSPR